MGQTPSKCVIDEKLYQKRNKQHLETIRATQMVIDLLGLGPPMNRPFPSSDELHSALFTHCVLDDNDLLTAFNRQISPTSRITENVAQTFNNTIKYIFQAGNVTTRDQEELVKIYDDLVALQVVLASTLAKMCHGGSLEKK